MTEARAFWTIAPGHGEIRGETLPPAGADQVLVRTQVSGVSRGTEALVFAGRVPQSQHQAMRAPLMGGEFPFPVKYGYSAVGRYGRWAIRLCAASAPGHFPRACGDVHPAARYRADTACGAGRQHGDGAEPDLGCRAARRRAHAGDRRRCCGSADRVAAGTDSRRARHGGGHRSIARNPRASGSTATSPHPTVRRPSRN